MSLLEFTLEVYLDFIPLIEVEVHVSQGLPSLTIVGLPGRPTWRRFW